MQYGTNRSRRLPCQEPAANGPAKDQDFKAFRMGHCRPPDDGAVGVLACNGFGAMGKGALQDRATVQGAVILVAGRYANSPCRDPAALACRLPSCDRDSRGPRRR